MKKLLFVSAYNVTFIRNDIKILKKQYQVDCSRGNRIKKSVWYYFILFWITCWEVYSHDIVYCWFADYRARIAVFWAEFWGRRSVVVAGGYEVREMKHSSDQEGFARFNHLQYCLEKADRIIAVSDDYYHMIRDFKSDKDNVIRIYNGIDLQRSRISYKKQENLVITVCIGSSLDRIHTKGLDVFLKTAALLPEMDFVIIGVSGDLYHELLQQKRSDNVTIITEQNDKELNAWYGKAKIYCQLSRAESFGLALVEAMSFGCIPVVSGIPSLRERVEDCGVVIDDFNASLAAEAVLTACQSGEEDGKKARKLATENYDIGKREKSILQLLAGLWD